MSALVAHCGVFQETHTEVCLSEDDEAGFDQNLHDGGISGSATLLQSKRATSGWWVNRVDDILCECTGFVRLDILAAMEGVI